MAEAQLREYHPTLRDQIAIWLMGDSRPSVARRNFVEGLLGSSGLGTKGISLSDLTPFGAPFAVQDAKRSFDNGAYGSAALDLAGLLPAGAALRAIKHVRKAVKPLEDVLADAFGGTSERAADGAVRAAERSRKLEKTGLIRAMQWAGRSPDEIRRALADLDAAEVYRGTQPRLPAAEMPRFVDDLPSFDEATVAERVRAAHETPSAVLDDWNSRAATDYPDYAALLDKHQLKYYEDGPAKWVGPLGLYHGPTVTQSYGWLTNPRNKRIRNDERVREAHKPLQHAAVRNLPGYTKSQAPSILLDGRSNVKGTQHYKATQVQREPGGGSVGAELPVTARGLDETGALSPEGRHQAMMEILQYLKFHGHRSVTPTLIPGNRRKPKK